MFTNHIKAFSINWVVAIIIISSTEPLFIKVRKIKIKYELVDHLDISVLKR